MTSTPIVSKISQAVGLDVDYFFRAGFWVSARYALVSLLGLALTVGFARLGTRELFGQYQTFLAVVGIVSVVSLPGLNMAAFREVVKGKFGAVKQAVWYSFLSSLLGVPLLAFYGLVISHTQAAPSLGWAFFLAALTFPLLYATNTWYVFYEGQKQFAAVSWRATILSLFTTGAIICTLSIKPDLVPVVIAYIFATVVCNGCLYREVVHRIKHCKSAPVDVHYGLSVTFQKFVFLLSENLPTLAISFLFGYSGLALFQVAYFMMNAIAGLLNGLSVTYLPMLFQTKDIPMAKAVAQNVLVGVFFLAVLRVLIELLFIPLYGQDYQESLGLARQLSWLVICFPLKSFLTNLFTAKGKNLLLGGVTIFANAVALTCLYVLKDFGFSTAAFSYIAVLQFAFIVPLLGYWLARGKKLVEVLD